MIIKEYSCEDCFHESVCVYKKEMKYYFDKLQKSVNNNNFIPLDIPCYKTLPSVAFYSLKCEFFNKKGNK